MDRIIVSSMWCSKQFFLKKKLSGFGGGGDLVHHRAISSSNGYDSKCKREMKLTKTNARQEKESTDQRTRQKGLEKPTEI